MKTPGQEHYFKREFFTITELDQFARCPRLYFYSSGCGLRLADSLGRGQQAMNFGTALHAAIPILLATDDFQQAYEAFEKAWSGNDGDEKRNPLTAKMILATFRANHPKDVGFYSILPAPETFSKIRHPDRVSEYELAFAMVLPDIPLPLIGRVDGWCKTRVGGELWGLEYKTTSEMSERFLSGFKRNPQVLGYTLAMRAHGYPVKGVLVEALGVAKTTIKTQTVPVQPQDHELEAFVRWAQVTAKGILACEAAEEWPMDPSACTTYPQHGSPGYMCYYDLLCSVPDWTAMRNFYKLDRHLPYIVPTVKGEQIERPESTVNGATVPATSTEVRGPETALPEAG